MGIFMHILQYVATPRVVFSHLVAFGLLYDLVRQGSSKKTAIQLALLEELVIYSLWALIPNSLATILALYICIYTYEKVLGPRVEIRSNAKFVADDDIANVLNSTSPQLNLRSSRQADGRYYIETDLQYAEYSPNYWVQVKDAKLTDIDVGEVANVEEGCDFNIIKSIRSKGAEPRQCFYLSMGDGEKTVTLIAASRQKRDLWLDALQQFYGRVLEDVHSTWLTQLYREADVEEGECMITLDDGVKILSRAKRETHKAYVKELFGIVGKTSKSSKSSSKPALSQDQFGVFFTQTSKRVDMHQIYDRLLDKVKGEMMMNPAKFRDFLRDEQKEDISLPLVKTWIRDAETILPSYNLTSVGFTNHMLSEKHGILNRQCLQVYQDMYQPLCDYFIATSHNTYLMKDQLKGKSSVEAYINVLKRGCKCVELDCWDGPNNEPIIYHGHTLTSKILFRDVLVGIKEYAFCVSDYPVILSFENHCSVEQQKVMAKHLVDIFGDLMYTKQPPDSETKLPSPTDLKGYIIVKAKKLSERVDPNEDEDDDFSDEEEVTEEALAELEKEADDEDEEEPETKSKKPRLKSLLSGIGERPKRSKSKKDKAPKIAQELSDLVAYCQARSFKGFQWAKQNCRHYEMSSLGEKKAMKSSKEDCPSFLEYNHRQLSRVYPAGARIDSSNYDPVPLWNVGCQLVALNYQTPCRPMQVNQGLFQDNGGCGYVLKPDFMRKDNIKFDPQGPFDENKRKYLKVKIISGHQLPFSSESKVKSDRNLYVQVRIAGVEEDEQKEKTKNVKNNGYNPSWNEDMDFTLAVPELAHITFTAMETTATFLGQFTLPVKCLMQGYRRVPLQNKMSEPISTAYIFVHIEKSDKPKEKSEDI